MTSAEAQGGSPGGATRSGRHQDGKSMLQSWIDTASFQWAVNTVNGIKKDVDPRYSMRRFLEDAISKHALELEAEHHGGKPWPESGPLRRGVPGKRTRDTDE
ncbi:hypothetical protein GCM10012275_61610 [Longimycelium tulufanense]|uniref:Uncharacterized protein n=1 Tax=Longimycelium tulufanense TaxID=907463 RepID=A0A8J3FZ97_9PSEU|nr:hypothetical protein [Longimycelium tulufanense]GGM82797.1 hypothetical protein GCM10012275_61610 [Longimycelium tulufanense]